MMREMLELVLVLVRLLLLGIPHRQIFACYSLGLASAARHVRKAINFLLLLSLSHSALPIDSSLTCLSCKNQSDDC